MSRQSPSGQPAVDKIVLSDGGEAIQVRNAGLVILSPFLPRLLSVVGLLAEGAFVSPDAAVRAVHLLQFAVDTRADAEGHELVLNKILCDLPIDWTVPRGIEVEDEEEEEVQGLLRAVIQHWGALGNTSVAGLQESFLQREGTLRMQEDTWILQVASRPFDMLLDQVPWGFRTTRFPWMSRVVQVAWR